MTKPNRDPVNRVRYQFDHQRDRLIVDAWLEAGGMLPAHLHPRQEERWSVVTGIARFRLEKTKRTVAPEDGEIVVAPGRTHAVANTTDDEAHLRCIVIPPRNLQAFLEESAAAAREGLFLRHGVPRGLRGARWAAHFLKQYRDDTVMAWPPPIVQRALIAILARDA